MMKKILCAVLLTAVLLSCFAGCGKKLTVELGGGTLAGSADNLEELLKLVPTREGYDFVGWYADAAYTEYMTSETVSTDQKKEGVAYAKWIRAEKKTYEVREGKIKVTDAGKAENPKDIVYLSDDFNLTDLKRAGYTELEIVVTMKVCEVEDGKQHVFLYRNENVMKEDKSVIDWLGEKVFGNEKQDPDLLFTHDFEFELAEEEEEWGEMSFSTRVAISSLEKDLVLRYDASGSDGDTWYNKDVSVSVTPKK